MNASTHETKEMIPYKIFVFINLLAYNIMHKSYLWYLNLVYCVMFVVYVSCKKSGTSTSKRYYEKSRRFLIWTNTAVYIQIQQSPTQSFHSQ